MKKLFAIFLYIQGIAAVCAQNNIDQLFSLQWKTKIGITTYRSNIIVENDEIYIGSNGNDRNSTDDVQDGVYFINPQNGKVDKHIVPDVLGDNDVNGVVVYQNRIYFGSDNNLFYCYNLDGKIVWEIQTPANIESCPVLADLTNDSVPDVIFTIEGKGLKAVNGLTGKLLWWFTSDERRGYNGSPAVMDLNNDKIPDFLIGGEGIPSEVKISGFKMAFYGDHFYAINGVDGSILWTIETGSKIHSSPLLITTAQDTTIVFSESYGTIYFANTKGKISKTIESQIGLFASPVVSSPSGYLANGNSWFEKDDRFMVLPIDDNYFVKDTTAILHYKENIDKDISSYLTGRISATALFADVLGQGIAQFVVATENGELLITSEKGTLLHRLKLPAGAEATPLVKDIDHDGYLELLIACLDGNLYCYTTKSKGRIVWGQFRGDNKNTGVIKF